MEWDKDDLDQEREKLRATAELRRKEGDDAVREQSKMSWLSKLPGTVRKGLFHISVSFPFLMFFVLFYSPVVDLIAFFFIATVPLIYFVGGIIEVVWGSLRMRGEKEKPVEGFTHS